MATVNFKKLDPSAKLPAYSGSSRSSGMDIFALHDFALQPGRMISIPTGIAMQCPEGYEGQVRPRSGLAKNHQLTVLNTPGTIDNDFRSEILVLLINHSPFPYYGKAGERVAQLVVKAIEFHDIVEVTEFVDNFVNDRGDRGFGSSGKF
jgi:dUTP pyrophosphatase